MGYLQNACKPVGFGGRKFIAHMNKHHVELSAWGFSHIDVKKDEKAIDLGCGGGYNINQLLSRAIEGRVFGLDYSELSVAKSKKFNKKAILEGKCNVLQGNVLEMPFEDNTFSLATAFETIYYWPNIATAFKEVYRILKEGGKFMLCNESDGLNPHDEEIAKQIVGMTLYKAEQLENYLKQAGFKDIKIDNDVEKHWLDIVAIK